MEQESISGEDTVYEVVDSSDELETTRTIRNSPFYIHRSFKNLGALKFFGNMFLIYFVDLV